MINYKSIVLLTFLFALGGCDKPSAKNNWLMSVAERIQLSYLSLENASGNLTVIVELYCKVEQQEKKVLLQQAQSQWRATMDAWQHIQWVRFGPISENNDDWKIQFWPDKKNLVARKTRQILAYRETITQQDVASASVVIQGIGALELLLFDNTESSLVDVESETIEKQCQLALATARNLNATTSRVASAWNEGEFAQQWIEHNALLKQADSLAEAEGEVFDALLAQMERVKIDKLGGPLGYKNRSKKPNGYFSESWRSAHSIANIQSNIESFDSILDDDKRYDLVELLIDQQHKILAEKLLAVTMALRTELADVQMPLKNAVINEQAVKQIQSIYALMGQLNSLLKSEVAPALGITLGFNANDGD